VFVLDERRSGAANAATDVYLDNNACFTLISWVMLCRKYALVF